MIDSPHQVNGVTYFDIWFATHADWLAAKSIRLSWMSIPLYLVRSGAPLTSDQLFIRVSRMPFHFDHGLLLHHFMVYFGSYFHVQAMWIMRHDTGVFAGDTYILGRFTDPRSTLAIFPDTSCWTMSKLNFLSADGSPLHLVPFPEHHQPHHLGMPSPSLELAPSLKHHMSNHCT